MEYHQNYYTMKRLFIVFSFLVSALVASAQTIYICKNGSYTTKEISEGLEINSNECDSITFDVPKFGAPTVTVKYSGSSVTVDIPAYAASYITSTVSGANVSITNTQVSGEETTYVVSGSSTDGSLTINGSYKMTVELDGLNLTSKSGAPLDLECGKRIDLILKDGTTNSLADAASSSVKAALYSKGHMEIKGTGTLNVSGNANHAIASKEYIEIKNSCTINIVKAANDAMHIGQYFAMNAGTINIDENTKGDGIQVEVTNDASDENNGQMLFKGGAIYATISHEDCKAIKADSNITITGTYMSINANGNGSRGIQTDGNLVVGQEDGMTAISINAAGGKCTLAECAADPHKCTGIKVDGDMTVKAGTIKVNNSGKKSKGIKVGGTYNKIGGTVDAIVEAAITL